MGHEIEMWHVRVLPCTLLSLICVCGWTYHLCVWIVWICFCVAWEWERERAFIPPSHIKRSHVDQIRLKLLCTGPIWNLEIMGIKFFGLSQNLITKLQIGNQAHWLADWDNFWGQPIRNSAFIMTSPRQLMAAAGAQDFSAISLHMWIHTGLA